MAKQTKPIVLKPKEEEVETYLRRQCAIRDWDCWKVAPVSRKGLFDRVVLPGHGLVVFVELKREKGKITKLQARLLDRLVGRRYKAFIVEGKDEVDRLMNWIENELRA